MWILQCNAVVYILYNIFVGFTYSIGIDKDSLVENIHFMLFVHKFIEKMQEKLWFQMNMNESMYIEKKMACRVCISVVIVELLFSFSYSFNSRNQPIAKCKHLEQIDFCFYLIFTRADSYVCINVYWQ